MDAARGPSFAADQDEGPQRGSGRPIPPLVSEIQAATTNAGARAQGDLTPDFLALSYLGLQNRVSVKFGRTPEPLQPELHKPPLSGDRKFSRGSVRIHLRRRCLARIPFESFSGLNGIIFSQNDNVRLKAGQSFSPDIKRGPPDGR